MATNPAPVNWEALLRSDPVLQTALGQVNQSAAADKTALTAGRQSELVRYGAVPQTFDSALVGNVAQDITPATGQEAQAATNAGLSTVAQLAQAYNRAQQGSTADLAARGLLHSGAYRQESLGNLQGYQAGQANAQNQLLSNLAGQWNTYQGQQQALAGQAQTATGTALQNLTSQIQAGLISSPTGTPGTSRVPGGTPTTRATVGSFTDLIPKPTAANINTPGASPRQPRLVPTGTAKPLY